MESKESQKIKLYSYSKVWNTENKIYSIQNFVLPAPINPYEALYFILVMGFIFILGKIIPPIQTLPGVVTYIVFPYLITTYLRKKKLDGKNPIKYLFGFLRQIMIDKGTFKEGFKTHKKREEKVTLSWKCSYNSTN